MVYFNDIVVYLILIVYAILVGFVGNKMDLNIYVLFFAALYILKITFSIVFLP